MIAETLGFLAENLGRQLRREIGTDRQSAYLGLPPANEQAEGLYLSLIQIQHEADLRAMASPVRSASPHNSVQQSLHLKLVIMLSAHYPDYRKSLATLEAAIAQFASQPLITRQLSPELPAGLDRISLEWQDVHLAETSAIWSSLGNGRAPCAFYSVRGLQIRPNTPAAIAPAVETAEPEN